MGLIDILAQSVEIDGLKFAPITLADWAEFTWYYKYAPLREAEFATKDFPPEMRRSILKEVLDECKNRKAEYVNPENPQEVIEAPISFEHPDVQVFIQQPEGMIYLFYISLRHNNPSLTLKKVEEIATDEFTNKFLDLVVKGEDKEQDGTNPTGNQ